MAVGFFGDGANNTGSFHESLNLAGIWKLPVVYVCENNLYATHMPFTKATAGQNVAIRGQGYDMPGIQVNGQDVLAIYEVAGEAVARARAGEGPTLIEAKTYRFGGHAMDDPGTGYRPDKEIAAWKARDPIKLLATRLLENGVAQAELEAIHQDIEVVLKEAIEFASNSPFPDPQDATSKLFAESAAGS